MKCETSFKVFFPKQRRKNSPMRKCFYGYSQNNTGPTYCPKGTLCSGMYANILLGKIIRTLLEWADALLSKKWEWVSGLDG